MAFDLANFGRGTMNCNIDGPTMHMYNAGADTNATVIAASYFDDVADLLLANDLIYIVTDAGAATATIKVLSITAGVVVTSPAGTVQTANITVTAAELLAAYATPLLILPAGSASDLYVIHDMMVEADYGTAVFASGGATALQYHSTANGAGVLATATIAAATINAWAADSVILVQGACATAAAANTVGKGIYLSNQTGAFTGGTATVLNLHISYNVVTTAL